MRNSVLNKLYINKKTGKECFRLNGKPLNTKLLEFWQWCNSDLLSNTARGILAEFLVACDLGITNGVRTEWDAYDLKTKIGITVEIKSAAYLQSWKQDKLSRITFGIAPTYGWNSNTNTTSTEKKRQADAYVFCLLNHTDKTTVDPLDLEQWKFFILPTIVLDREVGDQQTLSLSNLKKLKPKVVYYGEIGKTIDDIFG